MRSTTIVLLLAFNGIRELSLQFVFRGGHFVSVMYAVAKPLKSSRRQHESRKPTRYFMNSSSSSSINEQSASSDAPLCALTGLGSHRTKRAEFGKEAGKGGNFLAAVDNEVSRFKCRMVILLRNKLARVSHQSAHEFTFNMFCWDTIYRGSNLLMK